MPKSFIVEAASHRIEAGNSIDSPRYGLKAHFGEI